MMNMTQEQVQAGLAAGLALTDPEGDASVPMKHASGALILRQLLMLIASGQVALQQAVQEGDNKPPPNKGPAPNPRKKTAKKTARKKAPSKKK